MHIYVISLKKDVHRRINFDKINSEYIEYEYFDAIDGNSDKLDITGILKPNTISYSKGQIGCALSHLHLWNKCIEKNEPMIIMEDDAFVSKFFKKHLNSILNMLPSNWHIVQLTYNCDSILGFSNTSFENAFTFFSQKSFGDKEILEFQKSDINPTIAKLNISFGTGCYILNPTGAAILKKLCFPMDNRILNIPLIGKLKAYSIDGMMIDLYSKMNAYVCPIPFVMTNHLHKDYKSST